MTLTLTLPNDSLACQPGLLAPEAAASNCNEGGEEVMQFPGLGRGVSHTQLDPSAPEDTQISTAGRRHQSVGTGMPECPLITSAPHVPSG